MSVVVRRQVRLLRRTGEAAGQQWGWTSRVEAVPGGGLDVRIAAPDGLDGVDLETSSRPLHEALLSQLPSTLRAGARSEVGVVQTATRTAGGTTVTSRRGYALAVCADVVVMLVDEPSATPVVPWCDTIAWADVDPRLPVVLSPSAVLALTAGWHEMADAPESAKATEKLPAWMAVRPVSGSPYPPHDAPPAVDDVPDTHREAIAYWIAGTEHWLRPMRTTRAWRGRYDVTTALPAVPAGPAVWLESLVSLDTRGRCWYASLSVWHDGARRWLTLPLSVEASAEALLGAAVGQVAAPRPALDRDPIDGESYGWAPALLVDRTAGALGLCKRSGSSPAAGDGR